MTFILINFNKKLPIKMYQDSYYLFEEKKTIWDGNKSHSENLMKYINSANEITLILMILSNYNFMIIIDDFMLSFNMII